MQFITSVMATDNIVNVVVSTALINLSFFICCYWIYTNETQGRWERYRIRIMDAVKGPQEVIDLENRKQVYKSQVRSVVMDLGLVMPLCFLLASNHMFRQAGNFFVDLAKTFLAYFLFRCWSFTVHVIMHKTPSLIKYHKQHHLPMSEMTCVSTFTDSMVEFLFMELFAEIAGICLIGGLPLFNIILLGVYNVVNGAIDHSGFCLHEFWFNSIYHFTHHAEPTWNYAELSYIDVAYGTYKEYPLETVVQHFRKEPVPAN